MIKTFVDLTRLNSIIGRTFKFLSANTWTTLSLILGGVSLYIVFKGWVYIGVTFFMISMLGDFIDGNVARYRGEASKLGAFWDGTVDRFVDALILMSFFFLDFNKSAEHMGILLFAALFVTLMPPFVVAYANHRGVVPSSDGTGHETERIIWRIAFRVEYLVLYLIALIINPINSTLSYWFLVAGVALMAETVLQSIIFTFIKSKKFSS